MNRTYPKVFNNQTWFNNETNEDADFIDEHIILNKSNEEISKEHNININQVSSTIKRFKRNSKLRARLNRRFLNKKEELKNSHLDFMKGVLSGVGSITQKVSSLKLKLEQNFEEMKNISESTVRRSLKKSMKMSYKKMSAMNLKNLIPENFRKMTQSSALLKILSSCNVELIFIDEFSVNSRHSNIYGWIERGKKELISQHNQAVSYSAFFALSSKRYSPWEICPGFSKRNMENNLKNEWRSIYFYW